MIKLSRNWVIVTMGAVMLAACGPDLSRVDYTSPTAPTLKKALVGAHKAANEEKLTGFIEVSEIRQGKSFGPGEFMLCLRGAASPAEPRRTYAVFFDDDDYKGVRGSVILDECEEQAFGPLPPAPIDTADDESKDKQNRAVSR